MYEQYVLLSKVSCNRNEINDNPNDMLPIIRNSHWEDSWYGLRRTNVYIDMCSLVSVHWMRATALHKDKCWILCGWPELVASHRNEWNYLCIICTVHVKMQMVSQPSISLVFRMCLSKWYRIHANTNTYTISHTYTLTKLGKKFARFERQHSAVKMKLKKASSKQQVEK